MHLLTINGSLQDVSANGTLLDVVGTSSALASGDVVTRSVSIGDVPHFRPDRDEVPEPVERFRAQIAAADAVVIATPEYAHSLPGSLKNALDWIVGSGELYDKPVVILCATHATNRGGLGRAALEQTLRAQGAAVAESRSVVREEMVDQAAEIIELLRAEMTGRSTG